MCSCVTGVSSEVIWRALVDYIRTWFSLTLIQLYNFIMNWITTNIRLPEDVYMDLKMAAARQRKSVAAVVRQRLGVKKDITRKEDLWDRLDKDKFSLKMTKTNFGISLTKKLVEMRYEQ